MFENPVGSIGNELGLGHRWGFGAGFEPIPVQIGKAIVQSSAEVILSESSVSALILLVCLIPYICGWSKRAIVALCRNGGLFMLYKDVSRTIITQKLHHPIPVVHLRQNLRDFYPAETLFGQI